MKTKLLFGILLLGILVLAVGGFTVRRSRRAIRVVLGPRVRPAARPALA
ncbi:MAG TPA: hypothetical protein VHK22_02265 [Gaiellaceae bacterium]|jgi:hypothetical protein|nr:hypothetical protein [Gaiellaceae bacterium]